MADDRVAMKAKATFNNPLITVHGKDGEEAPRRPDDHTVDEGDEFSTHEEHAKELETMGYAERTGAKAEPQTDRAKALIGSQTPGDGAIAANRAETRTKLSGKPEKEA